MKLITLIILLTSTTTFAASDISQNLSTTTVSKADVEQDSKEVSHRHFLGLELNSALANGVGANYHVAIGDNFTFGPNARFYEEDDLFDIFGDHKYSYTEFGLQTKYRFRGTGKPGMYAGLNYLHQMIKGEVKSTLFSTETKGKSKTYNKDSAELQVGYVFLLGRPKGTQFFIDVSSAYGRQVVDGYTLTSDANSTDLKLKFQRSINIYGQFGFAF